MKKLDAKRLIFVLTPLYILIASMIFGFLQFGTNDDVFIMDTLSGRMTGEPYACTSYFHIFLGFIISRLYKIAYLPWYPALIVICTILGEIALFDALYSFLKSKANIFFKIFSVVLNVFLSAYVICQSTFTVAATLMGVAAIYLLYKNRFSLSVLALLLATAIRYESGFLAYVFWVATLAIMEYKQNINILKLVKKVFLRVMVVAFAVLAVYASDEVIKAKIEPKDYTNFRKAQHVNCDFLKSKEFEQNTHEILESIGWNEELYSLNIANYFSMDDRITLDSLKTLGKYKVSLANFSLANFIDHIKYNMLGAPEMLMILMLAGLPAIYLLYALRKSKKQVLYIIVYIVTIILLLYLALLQRMITRSVLSIVLPLCILQFISFENLEIEYAKPHKYFDIAVACIALALFIFQKYIYLILLLLASSIFEIKDKKAKTTLVAIFSVAIMVFGINSSSHIVDFAENAHRWNNNKTAIESYAIANRENIYVYGSNYMADSRMNPSKESIYNLFPWGGTFVHSSSHIKQMAKAGLEQYDISEFAKDNVYFVDVKDNPWSRDYLEKLLAQKGISGQFKLYDSISNIGIYKLGAKQ